MVAAEGHIEVVRGTLVDGEYITVCRTDGTALFEGLLPPQILEDFKSAWLVRQDGPENSRGVTVFRLTEPGKARGKK